MRIGLCVFRGVGEVNGFGIVEKLKFLISVDNLFNCTLFMTEYYTERTLHTHQSRLLIATGLEEVEAYLRQPLLEKIILGGWDDPHEY